MKVVENAKSIDFKEVKKFLFFILPHWEFSTSAQRFNSFSKLLFLIFTLYAGDLTSFVDAAINRAHWLWLSDEFLRTRRDF